jgi:hypothetical protein
MESIEKGWKPRSIWAWLLTLGAGLLALIMAVVAYFMRFAVRFDSVGGIAALYALLYPLHLLLFAALAAVMAYIALRSRARLAAWVYGAVAIATILMALVPTFAILQQARELGVPVSLGNYLANAGHMNSGEAQIDRSIVYATAKDGTSLQLDVWRSGQPNTGPLRPAVVFVHGGGWV